MKRFLLLGLTCILVCVLWTSCAFAESASVKTQVKGGSLHLRAGAGKEYATNGYVQDGDAIEVLAWGEVWSQVQSVKTGISGFIKNIYIQTGSTSTEETPAMQRGKNVYVSENGGSLRVRAGAGTGYAINGYVQHGDAITILSEGSTWSMIRVDHSGLIGFIRNDYIYGYGTAGWSQDVPSVPDVTAYDAAHIVTKYANSTVNLRAEASASSTSLAKLKKNTYLKVTGSEGNWYQVTTKSGLSGYVSKNYTTLGASAKTTANLNVRKGAGSSTTLLTTLSKGTQVTILSVDGNWCQIRYGKNKTGYVSIRFLNY